jgi:stage V sporulation protein G
MEIVSFRKVSIGKIRATVDIKTSEGFVIRGFKVVEGDNGLFIGMPSERTRSGKYMDLVKVNDPILREMVEALVLDYYYKKTGKGSSESPDD